MNIITSNTQQSISLGGVDTWMTLCSTMRYYLSDRKNELSHAFSLIESGHLSNQNCLMAAREFNLVRDALSQIDPSKIIYDDAHPDRQPPWGNNISPVITSCSNYLTSGSGDDLLAEIVKILTYAAYTNTDVDLI